MPIEARIGCGSPMNHQELLGSLPVTFATTTPTRGAAGSKGSSARLDDTTQAACQ